MTLPNDLKHAASELIVRFTERMKRTGFKSESIGTSTTSYDFDKVMNLAIERILNNYKVGIGA